MVGDIDAADDKICSFRSDLDMIVSDVEKLVGDELPLADHVRLQRAGIRWPERVVDVDPERLLRALVFADELAEDTEAVKAYAERLRRALPELYRDRVIEGGR